MASRYIRGIMGDLKDMEDDEKEVLIGNAIIAHAMGGSHNILKSLDPSIDDEERGAYEFITLYRPAIDRLADNLVEVMLHLLK